MSCFMPVGHSKAKNTSEQKPKQTTDVAQCAYFTRGPAAINPNCRVCSVFPRAVVLSGWVGIFHFIWITCFPPSLARTAGLADAASVLEDAAFGLSPHLLMVLAGRLQDLSFNCLNSCFRHSILKDVLAYKAPLHIHMHLFISSFFPSGSTLPSPHRTGPRIVKDVCFRDMYKCTFESQMGFFISALHLILLSFFSLPLCVSNRNIRERKDSHSSWPRVTCLDISPAAVGNRSMWGTENLHGLGLFPAGSDAFQPALIRVWTLAHGMSLLLFVSIENIESSSLYKVCPYFPNKNNCRFLKEKQLGWMLKEKAFRSNSVASFWRNLKSRH